MPCVSLYLLYDKELQTIYIMMIQKKPSQMLAVLVTLVLFVVALGACASEQARGYVIQDDQVELLYGQIKQLEVIVCIDGGSKVRYDYDERGSLVAYDSMDSSYRVLYVYDSLGRRAQRLVYYRGEELPSITEYRYGVQGTVTQEITLPEDDTLTTYYEYASQGRPKSIFIYKGGVEPIEEVSLLGKRLERPKRPSDVEEHYHYNDRGRLVRKDIMGEDGCPPLVQNIVYNERGFISYTTYTEGEGGEVLFSETYTYKYDQKGNWVERKAYYDATDLEGISPDEIVVRNITYY